MNPPPLLPAEIVRGRAGRVERIGCIEKRGPLAPLWMNGTYPRNPQGRAATPSPASHPSSRSERCERHASGAPNRDLVGSDSLLEVPGSLTPAGLGFRNDA